MNTSFKPQPAGSAPQRQHGFTLIEILIALVILAIAGLATLMALQHAIHALSHTETHLKAHIMAENRLAQYQIGWRTPPAPGTTEHASDDPLWQWTIVSPPSTSQGYQRLDIQLSYQHHPITQISGFTMSNHHE